MLDIIWTDSGDTRRGVGVITKHAQKLGYRYESFEEVLGGVEKGSLPEILLIVMTAQINETYLFISKLTNTLGSRRREVKIHLVMPDRGYPKSVAEFMNRVDGGMFDGIGHASKKLKEAATARFPKHLHWYFHNPVAPFEAIDTVKDRDDGLVMLSGALASGKGFLPFYQGAQLLQNTSHPSIKVIHTGVDYTVSKLGNVGGGMTVLSALCETIKPKRLRPGVETVLLDDEDSFNNARLGVLTAFPSYRDRALNMQRIARAKAFIVPILNEGVYPPQSVDRYSKHMRKMIRDGSLWSSAIEYSIWETFITGTPIVMSKEYVRRIIEPIGKERWPLPTYRTVSEAWEVASEISRMGVEEWRELQKSQSRYAETLRQGSNEMLASAISTL